ncbi:hypothetical protein, partial [Candidatus Arsenophonus triatominarum]|uniref:hypothetical protein n=1 Tax=Candidatus Arsenophonus triatominarum TaxID=57911 RepID=UPI001C9D22B1
MFFDAATNSPSGLSGWAFSSWFLLINRRFLGIMTSLKLKEKKGNSSFPFSLEILNFLHQTQSSLQFSKAFIVFVTLKLLFLA